MSQVVHPALLTTTQAAARLNLTARHVRWLCVHGRLPGLKVGRDWMVREADLPIADGRPRRGGDRRSGLGR
jgi:excisionase family DNA binding protein